MRKKRFLNLLCIGCIACGFAACSDDDNNEVGVNPNDREENAAIRLTLSQRAPGTYADLPTETATTAESDINGSVVVYIYDADGLFEKNETLPVTSAGANTYTGDNVIKVSSGNKYIYVFANMVAPSTPATRQAFETQVLNTAIASMTTANKFYIGSLEPQVANVPTTATETSPEPVTVKIGRLAAKVELNSKTPTPAGNVTEGLFNFSSAEYRVINEANGYYLVGQSNNGVGIGVYGNIMTSPHFTHGWPVANVIPPANAWTGAKAPGEIFYTKENTHTNPMNGSATSVQYRVQYTPDVSEVYGLDGKPSTGLNGTTFWMATVGDLKEKYLFDSDPTGLTSIPQLGDIEAGSIKEYTNGYVYYVIPIADTKETEAAAKYAVVRNHYYLLTINSIKRLGNSDPDEIIDEPEPIDQDAYIDFTIEVLPWYKVEQEVDL